MGENFGLKRVLGLGDLVAIEVGTTIGAGIFSLTALAAKYTGPAVPLAFVAAAVPIIFVMLSVAMLGSVLPTVGGTYRYPSRLFSPMSATVGVWSYALALVIGALPLYATQCIQYLMVLLPGGQDCAHASTGIFWPAAAAVGLLTFFYIVNVVGISVAASVQTVMAVVMIVALLMFGIMGVPQVEPVRFSPMFTGGAGGFILAACILTFALQGSNSVIELGAEIKRPGRNIPLSLLISIPLVAVLYVVIAVSAVGNIELPAWLACGKQASLVQPALKFLSSPLFYFFILGGAFLAFTTTLNGTFMWATKSLLVIAGDRIMPPSLARTGKYGTPTVFLTALWLGSSAAVIADAAIRYFHPQLQKDPIEIFAAYATIGGLIVFIPVMIAAMVMPRRAASAYRAADFKLHGPLLYISPVIGIISSALMIVILVADLGWWIIPFPVWVGLGVLFYWRRKARIEAETGQTMAALMAQDLADMVARSRSDAEQS
jgi:basic amino acid/polyamine antiporter, APA family